MAAKTTPPATIRAIPKILRAVIGSPSKKPIITATAMLPPIIIGPPIVRDNPTPAHTRFVLGRHLGTFEKYCLDTTWMLL